MTGDKEETPQVQYSQPPEYQKQMELFNKYQEPYMAKQFGLYQDIFEPQTRFLGGILGEEMKQPMSLPEDVWSNIWQKGRERTTAEYTPITQKATERFAGQGTPQGAREKYFQSLDLSKAKSLSDLAIDMSIQEWTEKKVAKQQSLSNMQAYLTGQPAFSIPMPTSQAYTNQPQQGGGNDWMGGVGSILQGVGSVAPIFSGMFGGGGSTVGMGYGDTGADFFSGTDYGNGDYTGGQFAI